MTVNDFTTPSEMRRRRDHCTTIRARIRGIRAMVWHAEHLQTQLDDRSLPLLNEKSMEREILRLSDAWINVIEPYPDRPWA